MFIIGGTASFAGASILFYAGLFVVFLPRKLLGS